MRLQPDLSVLDWKTKAELEYNAKIKVYPNGRYKLICFSFGAFREKGFKQVENPYVLGFCEGEDKTKKQFEYKDRGERADNLKRARDKIFDIALGNKWDWMVTFTLDAEKVDRYDCKQIIKPFGNFLHNASKRKGLNYLIVPELHEDGAVHFHGLINDSLKMAFSETYKVPGKKKPVRLSTLRKMGLNVNSEGVREVYNAVDYKLGFSTAVKLDGNVEAVATYMTKYATKELGKIFGNYYFAGGDIVRELPSQLLRLDYSRVDAPAIDLRNRIGGQVKYLTLQGYELNKLLEVN